MADTTTTTIHTTPSYPVIKYTTITGYFLQDDPATNASTFDYVSIICRVFFNRLKYFQIKLSLSSISFIQFFSNIIYLFIYLPPTQPNPTQSPKKI